MFSKACEYGIRATLYIAMKSLNKERVSLRAIAGKTGSPEAFTSKILQQLVHHEIIYSVKGASGGFEINPSKMAEIMLCDVVRAIDGDNVFKGCVLGLSECSENHPCPVHSHFTLIRSKLEHLLENTSIYQLAQGVETGLTFLKQ